MQKLIVNCLYDDDLNFFNWYPNNFEIKQHTTFQSLLAADDIILLTRNNLKKYGKPDNIIEKKYVISMLQEGTNTVIDFLTKIGWQDQTTWPFILCSGDMPTSVRHFNVDIFKYILGNTTDELYLRDSEFCNSVFAKKDKPFLFNFLNGINRLHRQSLIEKLKRKNLLSKGLWSALYDNKFLPDAYCYQVNKDTVVNGKYINTDWPDGQLFGSLYEDTYFSIVTETNFYIPHSFRTEKIYKSLKVGHPFVAVANYGFYRDLHKQGYKTFGNLIDESFDLIDDNDIRLNRIADVIEDLCNTNLTEFLSAAEGACRHNRDLLMSTKVPAQDTDLLEQFLLKFNDYAKNT